ncbi:MAG: DUF1565 domain-containing protein, partial [Candidatus Hydrogenedentes bacterium]|nr:DUF1565 domain-containing protein [Candidatus Hydrogenedentota bacterium]
MTSDNRLRRPALRRAMRGTSLAIAALALAVSAAAQGAETIYVDAAGTGSGDGTSANPFRTIGTAMARAASGDTVVVRAGVYAERVRVSA